MEWYYSISSRQYGPIDDMEFCSLVESGQITFATLVWYPGLAGWSTYAELLSQSGYWSQPSGQAVLPNHYQCVECGRFFRSEQMVDYRGFHACGACKPIFFQRLAEGVPLPGERIYAGFWIRFAARLIDYFILWIANMIVVFPLQMIWAFSIGPGMNPPAPGQFPPASFFILPVIQMLLQLAIPALYETFFLGKYEATPGKLALGIKVVVADGSRISYLRAFARHFATFVSGLILMIGYIMAGFDEEKRSLHDRMCDTRVIYKGAFMR